VILERGYPTRLTALAAVIHQPDFPPALQMFIHQRNHPDSLAPPDDLFGGPIRVFHSATMEFYAPSDLCGAGGMYREVIQANPNFGGVPRFDTIFVSVSDDKKVMAGLLVARVRLLFSYFDPYDQKEVSCVLVTWLVHPNDASEPDAVTGMWKLCPEHDENGKCPVQVIHLDTILRGAHLLPCYGEGFLPTDLKYSDALDAWDYYFVNQFIDYHAHALLTTELI
jgi:hypothetical protein